MPKSKVYLRRLRLAALLLAGSACGDGSLGTECPRPSDCVPEPGDVPDLIATDFPSFSSAAEGTFRIVWQSDNRCVGACTGQGALLRGESDVAWSLPRSAYPARVERIDPAAKRTSVTLDPPRPSSGDLLGARTFGAPLPDGSVLLRAQWDVNGFSGERLAGPDEILTVRPDGGLTRTTLAVKSGATRLPLGTLARGDSFLLYALEGASIDVRLHDGSGAEQWRALLPSNVTHAGGSAAATTSFYVVGAGRASGRQIAFGLLWLSHEGNVLRVAQPSSGLWRTVRVLPIDGDRYAVAARSDVATVATSEATGNLDVARFRGTQPEHGVRFMRSCYHDLVVLGFSVDPEGNMFVSTVAGQNGRPRALLCRAPVEGMPQCFDPPDDELMLGEIVATSRTTLYASAGERILRIELPD